LLAVRQARLDELERCLDIRREVFVGEQRGARHRDRDAGCTHFLAPAGSALALLMSPPLR
jgi:hypothetical protein